MYIWTYNERYSLTSKHEITLDQLTCRISKSFQNSLQIFENIQCVQNISRTKLFFTKTQKKKQCITLIFVGMYVHVCECVYVCVCVRTLVWVFIYLFVCLFVCGCGCAYLGTPYCHNSHYVSHERLLDLDSCISNYSEFNEYFELGTCFGLYTDRSRLIAQHVNELPHSNL